MCSASFKSLILRKVNNHYLVPSMHKKYKVTVFRAWKINTTGGKTIEEINSAYNVIYNYLFELYLKLL